MKTINQFLKNLFTIEHLVHLVMILFAAASLANVATFFADAGHATVGWALGSALGSALVAVSIMATKIDRRAEPETFKIVAFAVLMLAMLSGAIQSRAYSLHLPIMWSVMLGFGLPVCGEALLAFAAAEYSAAYRRKRIRNATDGSKEKIAEAIAQALSDIDVSEVKNDVQRQVKSIVKYQVGQIANEMMGRNVSQVDTAQPQRDTEPRQSTEMSQRIVQPDELTKARQDKAATRRAEILTYIDSQDVATFTKSMAQLFDVSTRTIQRDIQQLESDGLVVANGVIVRQDALAV